MTKKEREVFEALPGTYTAISKKTGRRHHSVKYLIGGLYARHLVEPEEQKRPKGHAGNMEKYWKKRD